MNIKTFLFGGVHEGQSIDAFNTFTEFEHCIENFGDFERDIANLLDSCEQQYEYPTRATLEIWYTEFLSKRAIKAGELK